MAKGGALATKSCIISAQPFSAPRRGIFLLSISAAVMSSSTPSTSTPGKRSHATAHDGQGGSGGPVAKKVISPVPLSPTDEPTDPALASVEPCSPPSALVSSSDSKVMHALQDLFTSTNEELEVLLEKQVFSLSDLSPRTIIMIHSWMAAKGEYSEPYCQTTASFRDSRGVTLNLPGRFLRSMEGRSIPITMLYKGTKKNGNKTIHMLEFVKSDVVAKAVHL